MFRIKATKLYIKNVPTTPPTTQYTESDIIKPTCRALCPSADFSDFQRRHKRCLNERCFCISLNNFNCGNSSTSASSSLLLDIFDYAHKIFPLLFLLVFFLSLSLLRDLQDQFRSFVRVRYLRLELLDVVLFHLS